MAVNKQEHEQVAAAPTTNLEGTTYHIYPLKDKPHKRITTAVDLKRESPLSRKGRKWRKERRERREKEKDQQNEPVESTTAIELQITKPTVTVDTTQTTSPTPEATGAEVERVRDQDEDAFFLHGPYLSFASPPSVLYIGKTNHAPSIPAVLIKITSLWRSYNLQYGASLAQESVLDPRGVVAWTHNGGPPSHLKKIPKALKGYKVRTWRLWGECGKKYHHEVNRNRKNPPIGWSDPDLVPDEVRPIEADGVVHLHWTSPFSTRTREYRWSYRGVQFCWKGTKDKAKTGFWNGFMRWNHLKLVAVLPSKRTGEEKVVVIARYTSSVSDKKHGRLEVYDREVLRVWEGYARDADMGMGSEVENMAVRVKNLKKSMLYVLIIATAVCIISSEKAKRTLLGKWIKKALQNIDG